MRSFPKEIHKILVVQTAFIGDVILSTALLENIHQQYPDAHLEVLVRKGNESLFQDHPFIHEVIIWDKKNKYSDLLRVIKSIRKNQYDLLINLQRFFSAGLISILSSAKYIIGFSSSPISVFFDKRSKHQIGTDSKLHEIERNYQLLKDCLDLPMCKPKLYPKGTVFEVKQPYICIAPSSVWFTKKLPTEKWIEFLNQWQETETVYLIGGPEDRSLCDQIINESSFENCINTAGQLSLLESAALMKNARMNYVNDSAPLHLCSAVNAPVTAIFCSTVPEFGFGPLSDDSFIVESTPIPSCKPCGLHGKRKCPQGHFNCSKIEVQDLIKKTDLG